MKSLAGVNGMRLQWCEAVKGKYRLTVEDAFRCAFARAVSSVRNKGSVRVIPPVTPRRIKR